MGRQFFNPNANSGNGGGSVVDVSKAWSVTQSLSTSAPVVLAAAESGKSHSLTAVQASNVGAGPVELSFSGGGSDVWKLTLPPNVPLVFSTDMVIAKGDALSVRLSPAGSVRLNAQGSTK